MATKYQELVKTFEILFNDILESQRDYRHGLIGDGNGNIVVASRPDYVWAREDENSNTLWQVFNKRVSSTIDEGTPILIGELPWQPGLIQVLDIDWNAYARMDWSETFTAIPIHYTTHQWPTEASKGTDAVRIYMPALQPLKTTADGLTLSITVQALSYYYNNTHKTYTGEIINLTGYMPSAGYKKYVLICLNKITNLLSISEGTEVVNVTAITPNKPTLPSDSIPSAYVLLYGSQTSISQTTDVIDARGIFGSDSSDSGVSSGLTVVHLVADESLEIPETHQMVIHEDDLTLDGDITLGGELIFDGAGLPLAAEGNLLVGNSESNWIGLDAKTDGAILVGNGTTVVSTTSPMFVDLVNDRIGIGEPAPGTTLAVGGAITVTDGNGNIIATIDSDGNISTTGYIYTCGIDWTIRVSAADNDWRGLCYGNGLFVAVSDTGTGDRVMTSTDGINWVSRASASNDSWSDVCYGDGLFVAVQDSATGSMVMTSPDGITWTSQTGTAYCSCICYGEGLFVAVRGNAVMTSPNGITWTSQTPSSISAWISVCYGNGLFVAVSSAGNVNSVMTSPDGITWTGRTSASSNIWSDVCYGNGLFVAVSINGTNNKVMTSPDGITWTSRTSIISNNFYSVCYGNGLFIASGTGNLMTSIDGINWIERTSAASNNWLSICYGNGIFVSVSTTGTGNRVMTSGYQKENIN